MEKPSKAPGPNWLQVNVCILCLLVDACLSMRVLHIYSCEQTHALQKMWRSREEEANSIKALLGLSGSLGLMKALIWERDVWRVHRKTKEQQRYRKHVHAFQYNEQQQSHTLADKLARVLTRANAQEKNTKTAIFGVLAADNDDNHTNNMFNKTT